MNIDTTFDPAHNAVLIRQLAKELNEELAPRGSPDYKKIAEIIVNLRVQTSDIRSWVFTRLEGGPHEGILK